MLDRIGSNLKSSSTITMNRNGRNDRYTKILQNRTQPEHLLDSRSQRTNLSLSTRLGNSSLLLGLPNNKRRSKKNAITSDRDPIIRRASPGSIRIGLQLESGLAWVE
ncbi:hypothetical protein IHE45_02G047000 [Dioscorea alata]|uniref:Uncharacterized protein n=1 Tax=Dioscorea alata TaxID=55571 RepID=A0ACB7WQJ7_DIOAL|nr:hypothetical protein IHE45_02G047000 [Dioscorea alata]